MNVVGGGGRAFLEDVAVFVQRSQSNPESYESEHAATMAEKNLMTRLLLSARHNYRDQLAREAPPTSTSTVRRSIDLIHGHPDWDHSIDSLAREAGVSVRTLERAFRRDRGRFAADYRQRHGEPPSATLRT